MFFGCCLRRMIAGVAGQKRSQVISQHYMDELIWKMSLSLESIAVLSTYCLDSY